MPAARVIGCVRSEQCFPSHLDAASWCIARGLLRPSFSQLLSFAVPFISRIWNLFILPASLLTARSFFLNSFLFAGRCSFFKFRIAVSQAGSRAGPSENLRSSRQFVLSCYCLVCCAASSAEHRRPASSADLPSGEGFCFEGFVFLACGSFRFRLAVTVNFLVFPIRTSHRIASRTATKQQQQQH